MNAINVIIGSERHHESKGILYQYIQNMKQGIPTMAIAYIFVINIRENVQTYIFGQRRKICFGKTV